MNTYTAVVCECLILNYRQEEAEPPFIKMRPTMRGYNIPYYSLDAALKDIRLRFSPKAEYIENRLFAYRI